MDASLSCLMLKLHLGAAGFVAGGGQRLRGGGGSRRGAPAEPQGSPGEARAHAVSLVGTQVSQSVPSASRPSLWPISLAWPLGLGAAERSLSMQSASRTTPNTPCIMPADIAACGALGGGPWGACMHAYGCLTGRLHACIWLFDGLDHERGPKRPMTVQQCGHVLYK